MACATGIEAFLLSPNWESAYWISQVAVFGVACVAAMFAGMQLKTNRLFEILKFLQDDQAVAARRYILTRETFPDTAEAWEHDEELEKAASVICANYNIVGLVLRQTRLLVGFPGSISHTIVRSWAWSIVACYRRLRPLIELRSARRGTDYTPGFLWMHDRALRWVPEEMR
jgi:hypothetical protein